jgi:hypothetical protein
MDTAGGICFNVSVRDQGFERFPDVATTFQNERAAIRGAVVVIVIGGH